MTPLQDLSDELVREEFVNAFSINRRFYDDYDRERIVAEYKARSMRLPPTAVYQDADTRLWVVLAYSPALPGGYVIQGEHPQEGAAWEDARNWSETPTNVDVTNNTPKGEDHADHLRQAR